MITLKINIFHHFKKYKKNLFYYKLLIIEKSKFKSI
jgi:hypothetical protein